MPTEEVALQTFFSGVFPLTFYVALIVSLQSHCWIAPWVAVHRSRDSAASSASVTRASLIHSVCTGSLVVLANGVMDVITHSNVSLAPAPETLSLAVIQVPLHQYTSQHPALNACLPQRAFLALDQLIAANHQSQFIDIVPKGISGYLQKGFFDLRSCIQRRRNDFIKHHVSKSSICSSFHDFACLSSLSSDDLFL